MGRERRLSLVPPIEDDLPRNVWTEEENRRVDPLSPDYCYKCNYDTHICPGCGAHVPHGMSACLRATNGLECK